MTWTCRLAQAALNAGVFYEAQSRKFQSSLSAPVGHAVTQARQRVHPSILISIFQRRYRNRHDIDRAVARLHVVRAAPAALLRVSVPADRISACRRLVRANGISARPRHPGSSHSITSKVLNLSAQYTFTESDRLPKTINTVTRLFAHEKTNIARAVSKSGSDGIETDLRHFVYEERQRVLSAG